MYIVFEHNANVHLKLQDTLNFTFICTGKPERSRDLLYGILTFLWCSGTKPAISLRYTCISTAQQRDKIQYDGICTPCPDERNVQKISWPCFKMTKTYLQFFHLCDSLIPSQDLPSVSFYQNKLRLEIQNLISIKSKCK